MLRICFDLDQVIADGTIADVYSDEAGWNFEKCYPIENTVAIMKDLYEQDVYLIIHTARREKDRKVTEEWLAEYDIPYDELVMGKPLAHLYIDDRNYPIGYDRLRFVPSSWHIKYKAECNECRMTGNYDK